MAFEILIKLYPLKGATKRVKEILDFWEIKGYEKPNDVPPNDPYLNEFLQLMKGLGHPIKYRYRKKLKAVV